MLDKILKLLQEMKCTAITVSATQGYGTSPGVFDLNIFAIKPKTGDEDGEESSSVIIELVNQPLEESVPIAIKAIESGITIIH